MSKIKKQTKLSLHRLSICNYCNDLVKNTMNCKMHPDFNVIEKSECTFCKCPTKKW